MRGALPAGLPTEDGLFGFVPFSEVWVGRLAMMVCPLPPTSKRHFDRSGRNITHKKTNPRTTAVPGEQPFGQPEAFRDLFLFTKASIPCRRLTSCYLTIMDPALVVRCANPPLGALIMASASPPALLCTPDPLAMIMGSLATCPHT